MDGLTCLLHCASAQQLLLQLTFVGKVKSYEENAAQAARFLVEDSTDSITVMTYLQDKDTEVVRGCWQQRGSCRHKQQGEQHIDQHSTAYSVCCRA
jgi:hypothetical protein